MSALSILTLALAKAFTRQTALGSGAAQIPGPPGDSSYQLAVKNGFSGTEQEWLAGLKGKDGEGVPAGGAAGEALVKKTDGDFDTAWGDAKGGEVESISNATIQAIVDSL